LRRVGKQIAIEFNNGTWMVLHLMIAGRLHWEQVGATLGGRNHLAAFDFLSGSLVLTEAGAKRRASLHLFGTEEEMRVIDPGDFHFSTLLAVCQPGFWPISIKVLFAPVCQAHH
jgi:formamidopyrimidine-DNA glycosylase